MTVHIDKDLVAASATPLVLAILADGESYGYAILKRIRECLQPQGRRRHCELASGCHMLR